MRFNDNEDRKIRLVEEDSVISAYHNEDKVGYIQFFTQEYFDKFGNSTILAIPEQMHIDRKYQRCGIATEIIKYAKNIYDQVRFATDTGCGGNTDEIHYSSEGLLFKHFCEMNKITNSDLDYDEDMIYEDEDSN